MFCLWVCDNTGYLPQLFHFFHCEKMNFERKGFNDIFNLNTGIDGDFVVMVHVISALDQLATCLI
jgi:hypothetical protein